MPSNVLQLFDLFRLLLPVCPLGVHHLGVGQAYTFACDTQSSLALRAAIDIVAAPLGTGGTKQLVSE